MRGNRQVPIDRHVRRSILMKAGNGALRATNAFHSTLSKAGFRALSMAALILSSGGPSMKAQLPDAPGVIAPLKRYSFNLGMDSKYSLTSSVMEFTPRIGVSMRLGERETIGLSYSHPMPANVPNPQSNSVIIWTNFRVMSWGKIPKKH